ncbi:MAG TPA: alpha/beta hydrolase [Myxococcales bacterium]|nr:alpha/beta hydrolase [Myxococcales bacterium]
MPPSWGASALLHPARRKAASQPPLPFEDVSVDNDGLTLRGWLFRTSAPRRGIVVHLHGVSDNRWSGVGLAQRFGPRGWDVLVYDSRAHGESDGTECTYGFYEKNDVSRWLDRYGEGRVVLFGASLGAAVALQAAAIDGRVRGVIAQSTFSDLRTIASERAPFFASKGQVAEAVRQAEQIGRFSADEVSPLRAAAQIHVPVLLLHGEDDDETRPAHSQRVYEALAGPKKLLLVPGAGHNDVLSGSEVWAAIDAWLDALEN